MSENVKKIAFLARKQTVAGLIFIGIGVMFAFLSFRYPTGSLHRMGPGWFPAATAILLALIGVLMVLKESVSRASAHDPIRIVWLPVLLVCGSLGLFALALPALGIVPAIFILTVASTLPYRLAWWKIGLLATALSAIASFILVYMLDSRYPIFATF